jgi:RNA polymerase sigma factor (TIGR02999 family)
MLTFILPPSLTNATVSEKGAQERFFTQRRKGSRGAKDNFLCGSAIFAPLRETSYARRVTQGAQNITELLVGYGRGDKEALDQLMPIVYDELRRQAARYLRRERPGNTLQTTALIHEAYVRLVDQRNVQWQNRAHFFGIAAQLMRRILVDHARAKKRVKRGGSDVRVSLGDATVAVKGQDLDVVALDEALQRLAQIDEQQSRVVELRFFSGLTVEETAEVMHISTATVKRDWSMAKAWLHRELSGDTDQNA